MKKIGEFIRVLRKKSGFTANSLSDELNITPQCLNYWENGKRDINLYSLMVLSKVLRFKVEINNGEIRMEEVEDMAKNEVIVNVKDGVFDIRTVDVIKMLGEQYCIIAVYKVLLNDEENLNIENSELYFDNKKDAVRKYPDNEFTTEYQLIDKFTGFVPDGIKLGSRYAFQSVEDVESAYMIYLAPVLGLTPGQEEIVMKLNTNYRNEKHKEEMIKWGLGDPEFNVVRKKAYVYEENGVFKVKNSNITDKDVLVEGFAVVDNDGKQVMGTKALYKNIDVAVSDYKEFSTLKRLVIPIEGEDVRNKESFHKCVEIYNTHLEEDYKYLFG